MIPTSVVLSLLSLTITVAVAPLPASALSIPCLFTGTKEDVACSVLSRPNSGVTLGGFASSTSLPPGRNHLLFFEADAGRYMHYVALMTVDAFDPISDLSKL